MFFSRRDNLCLYFSIIEQHFSPLPYSDGHLDYLGLVLNVDFFAFYKLYSPIFEKEAMVDFLKMLILIRQPQS